MKQIALTFDDGPNPPYTTELLKVLAKHQVKAAFFVVGQNARKHPEVVKDIAGAGHLVGPHSMHHRFRDYFWPGYFEREVDPTIEIITKLTGQAPTYARNPWLFPLPGLKRQLAKRELSLTSGTFGNRIEIFQPSALGIAKAAARRAKDGQILIFHDGYNGKGGRRDQTVEAVDLLIPKLQQQGFKLVRLDELI